MKIGQSNYRTAFTLLEGVVVAAVILFLVISMTSAFYDPTPARRAVRINCVNNLKEDGIAFRLWAGDHSDKYPMDVPVALGGAQEMMATGKATACFQVMSNELIAPKILLCPGDQLHGYATNFGSGFTRSNVSYFVSLTMTNPSPETLFSGDDSLAQNGRPVISGIVNLATNTSTWTSAHHLGNNNILLPDGSVLSVAKIGSPASPGTYLATNRVVIP